MAKSAGNGSRSKSADTGSSSTRQPLAPHYKQMLAGGPRRSGAEGLESTASAEPDFSDGAIKERVNETRAALRQIVKEHLGDKAELHEIADEIAKAAAPALKAVGDENEDELASESTRAALEVIVRTDGSRPSFMVRDGEPDRTTSPLGSWADTLDASDAMLRDAIQCVGRIDDPSGGQGFQGTGILIAENLIMTNRHVLQAITTKPQAADGTWTLKPNIAIDFGHEFRARDSIARRDIKSVVFAGSKPIAPDGIDHEKLDLALLELTPVNAAARPRHVLALDLAPDWGQQETVIFIVGYPGNPGPFGNAPSLLELLFKTTFGCKRLAPGQVITTADVMAASPRHWTLGHDATTLGGNSGSAVLVVGREKITAGLHYGGRRSDPRENWCHVLGLTLDETDGKSNKTLRQHLKGQNVDLVDRLVPA